MRRLLMVEGVTYRPFRVRFRLADGRRRAWVRWSPGFPWVRSEVGRELWERFGAEGVRAGSASIRELPADWP